MRYFFRSTREYKNYAEKMYLAIVVLAVVIFFEALVLFFYAFRGTPETEALAINAKGQLSKMTPLNINDPALPRIIATDALSNMFQFTKESYPQQMEWNKSYFVDDGYNKYIKTLQDLNLGTYLKEGPVIFITNIASIEADPKTTGVFEGVKVAGFLVIVEHQIKTSKQSFSVPMTYSLVLRQKKEKEPFGLGFGIYHIKRLN